MQKHHIKHVISQIIDVTEALKAAILTVIIFDVFGVSIQTTSEQVIVHGEKIIGIKHTVLVDYIKDFCGLIGGAIIGL